MDLHEDNQKPDHNRSFHPDGKVSKSSSQSGKQEKYWKALEGSAGDRARTRTRVPGRDLDHDRCPDRERSSTSFYSDDYENVSHSDRSLSPQSSSSSPHGRGESKRVSPSPLHRTGVHKGGTHRPPPHSHNPQQPSGGMRPHSLTKHAPSKDDNPVTKRMMSARLLKINELKNALSELRLHADDLQRENRFLRQLQLRQEKALHRYNDTEGEISQLLSRHNNETHVLRERLRRSQDNQHTTERSLREKDAQLQCCRSQLQKLQRLADDHNLREREELSQKLVHAQTKLQESERRIKELEKNVELTSGSFQRQLANERRRTRDAQQEVKMLQEEVERLCTKLKEREKELDARNIYANRRLKASSKKELDHAGSGKGTSTSNTKAVQTEERSFSLNFASPPPDEQGREQKQEEKDWKIQEFWKEREKERELESLMERTEENEKERETELLKNGEMQQPISQKNSKGIKDEGLDREEEDWKIGLSSSQEEEESREQRQPEEEEHKARSQEVQATYEEAERQRKEQLLAKMREIDMQTQGHDSDDTGSVRSPQRLSEQQNQNAVFKLTDPEENINTFGSVGRVDGVQTQRVNKDLDLTFGSYAPSFGKPAPRSSLGPRNTNQNSNPEPLLESALELGGPVKDRKSNLMQQLFGTATTPPPTNGSSNFETLSPPLTSQLPAGPAIGRRRDTDMPTGLNVNSLPNNRNALQVSGSRPAVKAVTSFDDDIEEMTLD